MRLTDLLENLVNLPRNTDATDIHDLTIHGLTVNSAAVSKGDLFFALPGSRHDGRDFIDDAVAKGASAIVTDDRPFERQSAIAMPVLQVPNPRQVMAVAAARFWPQQSGMIAAVSRGKFTRLSSRSVRRKGGLLITNLEIKHEFLVN